MKTFLLILFVSLLNHAQANTVGPSKVGAGLMVGSIVSATGKYWLTSQEAIDFGIGLGSSDGISLYGDYLWHIPGMFGSSTKFARETSGYFGGGVGVGFWNNSEVCGNWKCTRRERSSGTGLFARGLFGMEWYPQETRFGVFAEIGPTLLLTPSTNGSLNIGLGGRYYF